MPSSLLEVRGLSKSFPGVRALDQVALQVDAGEVLAVVGENGAGKSTLMRILAGVEQPDAGEIRIHAEQVHFAGVRDAMSRGIALIHQELNLAENLSVTANLFLGREVVGACGWLRRREMNRRAGDLLKRVGLDVSPTATVASLPIGQRQLVEIARALSQAARLIIMDEPTSSLSQHETEILFEVIASLKRSGVAVLYISHRLAEVKAVADRVTVLRDGRNAGELSRDDISHEAMVRLMVGRDVQPFSRERPPTDGSRPRLVVEGVRYAGGPSTPVSFRVHAGEVVGMAGLVGAGRTELAEAIVGIRALTGGTLRIDNAVVSLRSPREAIARGVLLVPEDRRQFGLILGDAVQANIGLPNLDLISIARLVRPRAEAALARTWVDRLRIRTPRLGQPVGLLSGGNQQKVVFAKWLARRPKVLILDEPTRGVDVGARSEIYRLIDALAAEGLAVLMISSDLEEILGVSDRVLVMHEGRIAGELPRDRLSEAAVMSLATGGG